MQKRLSSLRQTITSSNLDAFLVSSYANISYFLDYYGFSKIERDAYILITQQNLHLFTNPLYANAFNTHSKNVKVHITTSENPFRDQLHGVLKKENLHSIGFEEDNLTVSEFTKIQKDGVDFVPDTLSHLRNIKSSTEITRLKNVCKLTDTVFEKLVKEGISPGITERELGKKLERIALDHNAGFSFPVIVAFGTNAAIPHHKTGDTKLQKNELILIDFGLHIDNYSSDMTRTFFIGQPTDEQKKAYEAVLKSQKRAIEFIRRSLKSSSSKAQSAQSRSNNKTMEQFNISSASSRQSSNNNLKASEVDKESRDYIITQGYPSIPHSVGHGIGIDVHEAPSLSPRSDDILQNGNVFSIEPGIYLPQKFGIRIEDLFAIQNNELIELTNSPKKLLTL